MHASRLNLTHSLKFILIATLCSLVNINCGSDPSFSLTNINERLSQDKARRQVSKVDVLWVIDNSISMRKIQENLARNFKSFITNFSDQNLDFQLAVAATDSYQVNSNYSTEVLPNNARFRDGNTGVTSTGVYIVKPNTPNLNQTFVTNSTIGSKGFGDERAFSSIEAVFNEDFNKSFFRPDSFLAIIIVSDEDDFSYNGIGRWELKEAGKPPLYPISRFVNFLDEKTGSKPGLRTYNVSSIHIRPGDTECYKKLRTSDQKFATRYEQLVNETRGTNISLCSDFSQSLSNLSEDIILASLRDTFKISRRPAPETITVHVNGRFVPRAVDGADGWVYLNPSEGDYLIQFTRGSIPVSGASIDINYDPYEF